MESKSKLIILCGLMLFGAGCGSEYVAPQIAEPLVLPSSATKISQQEGFGALPQALYTEPKPGNIGSVRVKASLPSIPPNITVLRTQSGKPDQVKLDNIGNAFSLPLGVIGPTPHAAPA